MHNLENARSKRHAATQEERSIAKAVRPVEHGPVERYGDVDHQMKKARVDGMRFQGDEIATNTIVKQIQVMRENADIYKMTMGEAKYNEQLCGVDKPNARYDCYGSRSSSISYSQCRKL